MSPAQPVILALDLGTTGCKAVVMAQGAILPFVARRDMDASQETGDMTPAAAITWSRLRDMVDQIMIEVGTRLDGTAVDCISICSAMHSLVVVDQSYRPLSPATLWADLSAATTVQSLTTDSLQASLAHTTGCPLRACYLPARLAHLGRRPPDWWSRRFRFLQLKDLVLEYLTGRCVTDIQSASTTGLLDQYSGRWSPEALDIAGIDHRQLPALADSLATVGVLLPERASRWNIAGSPAVIAGSTDGAMSSFGAGCVEPGDVALNAGTSGAIRVAADQPVTDPSGRLWRYLGYPCTYLVGGALNNIGLACQWWIAQAYADLPIDTARQRFFEEAWNAGPSTENGLLFLPYLTGDRSPWWLDRPISGFVGLNVAHQRGDLSRAVLESTIFCFMDLWHVLKGLIHADGKDDRKPVALTGALGSQRRWVRWLADAINRPIRIDSRLDGTLLGCLGLGMASLGELNAARALVTAPADADLVMPDPRRHDAWLDRFERFAELRHAHGIGDPPQDTLSR